MSNRRHLDYTIPSADEALSIYQMLTRHRPQILAYESKYGVNPDGSISGGRNMIAEANQDPLLRPIGEPRTLTDSLLKARDAFVVWANEQLPSDRQIDPGIVNPAAIYFAGDGKPGAINRVDASDSDNKPAGLENNLLVGGDGADILLAGKGRDVLMGRGGSDVRKAAMAMTNSMGEAITMC